MEENLKMETVLRIILLCALTIAATACALNTANVDSEKSTPAADTSEIPENCQHYGLRFDDAVEFGRLMEVVCDDGNVAFSTILDVDGGEGLESVDVSGQRSAIPAGAVDPLQLAKDINGNGYPDFLIVRPDGDSERAETLQLISLGPQIQILKIVATERPIFSDVDGDGEFEIVTFDSCPGGCGGSFDRSNADKVLVLDFEEGKYRLSRRHLFKPLTDEYWSKLVSFRKEAERTGDLPLGLEPYMTELVYQGQGRAAWVLFDSVAGSLSPDVKALSENEFVLGTINGTSYLDELLELNGWRYEAVDSCPEAASRSRFRELFWN